VQWYSNNYSEKVPFERLEWRSARQISAKETRQHPRRSCISHCSTNRSGDESSAWMQYTARGVSAQFDRPIHCNPRVHFVSTQLAYPAKRIAVTKCLCMFKSTCRCKEITATKCVVKETGEKQQAVCVK